MLHAYMLFCGLAYLPVDCGGRQGWSYNYSKTIQKYSKIFNTTSMQKNDTTHNIHHLSS